MLHQPAPGLRWATLEGILKGKAEVFSENEVQGEVKAKPGDGWTAAYRAHSRVDSPSQVPKASPVKSHYYSSHFPGEETEAQASQGLARDHIGSKHWC